MQMHPPGREIKLGEGAEFKGVSCKCTPYGRECTPSEGMSHIVYWAEEGVAFNLEDLRGIS